MVSNVRNLDTIPSILIAGELGSGKTTLAKRIAHAYDRPYLNVGDLLVEECVNFGIRDHPDEVTGMDKSIAYRKIRTADNDHFARMVSSPEKKIVDGLRHLYDANAMIGSGAKVISLVNVPLLTSTNRVLQRGSENIFDFIIRYLDDLNSDPNDPLRGQVLQVIALAGMHGVYIDGTQSKEQVFEQSCLYIDSHQFPPVQ